MSIAHASPKAGLYFAEYPLHESGFYGSQYAGTFSRVPGAPTRRFSADAFPLIARELAEPALDISYDEAGLLKLEQHIGRLLKEGFST